MICIVYLPAQTPYDIAASERALSGCRMSGGRGPCRFCLTFIFAIAFLALYFFLTYRPITPRYYVASLSLAPAPSAAFELVIVNRNKELGVYHDSLNLSFSFPASSNSTSSSSAAAAVPGFYQGHRKTAFKRGSFSSPPGERWPLAANGSAVLRVALESAVRYKAVAWRSRRRRIRASAEVRLDREGKQTGEDWIRLNSGAAAQIVHSTVAVGFACLAVLFG